MRKLRLHTAILTLMSVSTHALADGVNGGLSDPEVVSIVRPSPATGQPLTIGSNQVGRPGVGPDQLYGYDVNVAYDHVAVGMAIMVGLFLMTEWMDVR